MCWLFRLINNISGGDYYSPGNDYNQEIVDFAVSQFSGINEKCYNIEVENFQSQVSTNYVEVRDDD